MKKLDFFSILVLNWNILLLLYSQLIFSIYSMMIAFVDIEYLVQDEFVKR